MHLQGIYFKNLGIKTLAFTNAFESTNLLSVLTSCICRISVCFQRSRTVTVGAFILYLSVLVCSVNGVVNINLVCKQCSLSHSSNVAAMSERDSLRKHFSKECFCGF